MRSGGVLRNNYFIYTLPDQRMIKICRPRQGKQGLCCANLCRRSKGSAVPTCAGEARALLCRPAQEKQGLCCADLCRRSKGSAMPTCAGEAKALLCRPAQGKQRLCYADLRRGSKGSAVPTCAGEAKALLCRPAGVSGTNRNCTPRENRCRIGTASISRFVGGTIRRNVESARRRMHGSNGPGCAGRMEYWSVFADDALRYSRSLWTSPQKPFCKDVFFQ